MKLYLLCTFDCARGELFTLLKTQWEKSAFDFETNLDLLKTILFHGTICKGEDHII